MKNFKTTERTGKIVMEKSEEKTENRRRTNENLGELPENKG